MRPWKMEKPCADCPFNNSGPGRRLRRSLAPGRWCSILHDLRTGHYFLCHKTSSETGNGKNFMCAGALAWQIKRGLSSNYERIMRRLDAIFARKGTPS